MRPDLVPGDRVVNIYSTPRKIGTVQTIYGNGDVAILWDGDETTTTHFNNEDRESTWSMWLKRLDLIERIGELG